MKPSALICMYHYLKSDTFVALINLFGGEAECSRCVHRVLLDPWMGLLLSSLGPIIAPFYKCIHPRNPPSLVVDDLLDAFVKNRVWFCATEAGGVKPAAKTDKGSSQQSSGTMAEKAIERASVGRSAPLRTNPDPAKPNKEIDTDCTTLRALKEPKMDRARPW